MSTVVLHEALHLRLIEPIYIDDGAFEKAVASLETAALSARNGLSGAMAIGIASTPVPPPCFHVRWSRVDGISISGMGATFKPQSSRPVDRCVPRDPASP